MMVHVYSCYHFTSQSVVTSNHEPLATYCDDNKLFVATAQCYVEVYDLEQKACPMIHRFPTVSPVKQIAYSKRDDYIATLEGTVERAAKHSSHFNVRVYINWTADLTEHPIRARVAGDLTSMRIDNSNDEKRMEVVEIPLKDSATCMAVHTESGQLALGLAKTILIYGICHKSVPDYSRKTSRVYKDLKCLLELKMSFKSTKLYLCEEYIACMGRDRCQVMRLNIPGLTDNILMHDKKDSSTEEKEHKSTPDLPVPESTASGGNPKILRPKFSFRRSVSNLQPELSEDSDNEESGHTIRTKGGHSEDIIVDENVFNLAPSDAPSTISNGDTPPLLSSRSHETKTLVLSSVRKAWQKVSEKRLGISKSQTSEILGPVANPRECPVYVEYEGVCFACDSDSLSLVERGALTYLYRKVSYMQNLLSIQLQPVYNLPSGGVAESDFREEFLSPQRKHLVGLFCFISTSREGWVYDILNSTKLLTTYSYASEAISAYLGEDMLHVTTAQTLEVYTSRALSAVLHREFPKECIPDVNADISLVGLQPFIGLCNLHLTTNYVILISKITDGKSEDISWSLYALQKPTAQELWSEMIELAKAYQTESRSARHHLLQEAYLHVRGNYYLHGNEAPAADVPETDSDHLTVPELIAKTALMLGVAHARCSGDDDTAVKYFLLSGITVTEMLQTHKENNIRKETLTFINHVMFKEPMRMGIVSQEDADNIVELFAEHLPRILGKIVLHSSLTTYTKALLLKKLCEWLYNPTTPKSHKSYASAVLAAAILHLSNGEPEKAETLIFSLSKGDTLDICLENPGILHQDMVSLTPISQLLRQHRPLLFLQIISQLCEKGIFTISSVTQFLQPWIPENEMRSSTIEGEYYKVNTHLVQFLELMLSEKKREHLFSEVSVQLATFYLTDIDQVIEREKNTMYSSVKDVLPKGDGCFTKRPNWLDYLPPFTGPRSLRKPCRYLSNQSRGAVTMLTSSQSKQKPASSGEHMDNTGEDTCSCVSCHAALIKLQALLSSPHCGLEVSQKVLDAVSSSSHQSTGHQSILSLCYLWVDAKKTIKILVKEYPVAVPLFVSESLPNDQELISHVTTAMLEKWKSIETERNKCDEETYEVNKTAMTDLLNHLATLFSPKDFVKLLPSNGNLQFFMTFLEQSIKSQQFQEITATMMQDAAKHINQN